MDNELKIPAIADMIGDLPSPKACDPHVFIVIHETAQQDGMAPHPVKWTAKHRNKIYEFSMDITESQSAPKKKQQVYYYDEEDTKYFDINITKKENGIKIDECKRTHVCDTNIRFTLESVMYHDNVYNDPAETSMADAIEKYRHVSDNKGLVFVTTDNDKIRQVFTEKEQRRRIEPVRDYVYFLFNKNKTAIKVKNRILLPYKNGEGITVGLVENTLAVSYINNDWCLEEKANLQAFANILVGKTNDAYRRVRNSFIPCELWDVLNINARDMYYGIKYNVNDLLRWMEKNTPTFLKYSKFIDLVTTTPETRNTPVSTNFTLLLLILWYYPQSSLILSMHSFHIIHTIMRNIENAQNKANLKSTIMALSPLFNENATEGNKALTIPKHTAEFLEKKEADLKLYYAWANIIELLPELRDKNKFEAFIRDPVYVWATTTWNQLDSVYTFTDILKYGYTNWRKLFRYIEKQSKKQYDQKNKDLTSDIVAAMHTMKDYLDMCDFLDVTIDYYPQDIYRVHNSLSAQKQEAINEGTERFLQYLGTACTNATAKLDNDKYCVIFPKTVQDFINEGQAMSNCVGGYHRNVVSGRDIIFFIRRKSNPDLSYVTGEYVMGTKAIGQLYKAHNRAVDDPDVITFANDIAKALRKIPSLRISDVISQAIT